MFFKGIGSVLRWQAFYSVIILSLSLSRSGLTQDKKQQLDDLRQEITRLQQKVAEFEKNESSALEHLRTLDQQIDLTHRLIGQLRKQEAAQKSEVSEMARGLNETRKELDRLQQLAAQRAVYFYKYGRIPDLEMLLTSRSMNQVLLWAEFQRRLAENDHRVLNGIKTRQVSIQQQKDKLETELAAHKQLLSEKVKEESLDKSRRAKRQQILTKLRKDKGYHQMKLAEQQAAAERIAKLIASEATTKATEEITATFDQGSFSGMKGRLPWPVNGSITSHYGSYRHPVLKTLTNNLGIDIAAEANEQVRCVAAGKVITITWQRGYGNLVMVGHADGYFTVYTHLGDILVAPGENVIAGQAIGTVAEGSADQQASLHFQIWKRMQDWRSQDLNPEEWLHEARR